VWQQTRGVGQEHSFDGTEAGFFGYHARMARWTVRIPQQIRIAGVMLCVISAIAAGFAVCCAAIGDRFFRFDESGGGAGFAEDLAGLAAKYAFRSRSKNDVIFLGASSCLMGINPLIVQKHSGLVSYNLATVGATGGIDSILCLANGYLSTHPKPKGMVLCLCPEQAPEDPSSQPLAREFVRAYGAPFGIAPKPVSGLNWPRERTVREGAFVIRNRLRDFLGIHDLPMFGEEPGAGLGFQGAPGRGYREQTGDGGWKLEEHPGFHVAVAAEWRQGVRALARLLERSGCWMMVCFTPLRSDARSEDFSEVVDWLRSLHAEFPQTVTVKLDTPFYEPVLCYDRLHLNREGAERFSKAIAADLKAFAGRDRTVSVAPPPPERPGS
jgi:hypothetical protein